MNLGRLVQNILCDSADVTYCFEASAMLIVGELASGILVACMPTLGPVCFPNRFGPKNQAAARLQYNKMRSWPLRRVSLSDGALALRQLEEEGEEGWGKKDQSVERGLYEEGPGGMKPARAVVRAVGGCYAGSNDTERNSRSEAEQQPPAAPS